MQSAEVRSQPISSTQPTVHWDIKAKPLLWLLLPLAVFAFWKPDRLWSTLFVGASGALLISYLWARSLAHGIRARRVVKKQWVTVGDRLIEAFEVHHFGRFPALWFELRDHSNLPNYHPSTVRSLSNRQVRWQQEAICEQRGQFRLGAWEIVTQDPLGLFQITHRYPIVTELVIYPPVHVGLPIRLPAGESEGQIDSQARAWEATTRVAGIRPYAPQDPFRWIHWPKTARTNRLQVRQFDRDEGGDIWLVLDLDRRQQIGENLDSTHEQAIIIATALITRAIHENRAIGLAIYSRRPVLIPPSRGHAQRWKLLRALATVLVDGTTDLATGLQDIGRTVRRGSSIIVLTPTVSADFLPAALDLRRRGIGQQIVLLERSSFGASDNSWGLHESIRKLGIPTNVLAAGQLGQRVEGAI